MKTKIGISINGIGENPVAIIKGIVVALIILAFLFPLSIISSLELIFENKLKFALNKEINVVQEDY